MEAWRFSGLIFLLAGLLLLPACGGRQGAAGTARATAGAGAAPAAITVFAAASLAEPFGDIGQRFEKQQPGSKVVLNLAGSQQLAQQLEQGAPADVFASADQRQMGAAVQAGRVVSGTAQVFAHNRLAVIVPADNPARLERLQDLARPGLRLILAASEVPVGQYSLEFLDRASRSPDFGPAFREAVLKNVVSYEENVKAVLAKVTLGEGDAGIVYRSDAAPASGKVGRLEIPDALNPVAAYWIAPVDTSPQPDLARAFVALVLSPAGQEIISRYGFDGK